MSSILEDYYSSLHNVVLRDVQGNPSIFVKHYKQNSNEFYSGLPNHVHPAFIYQDSNGNLQEDDAILIGKYQSSELTSGGDHYSLPYKTPAFGNVRSLENKSWAIDNTGLMTWADYGLLMLMLQKSILDGYSLAEACGRGGVPKGEYATWYPGLQVNAGETYAFMGWLYKCRTTHTTDVSKLPENTPGLWEKLYRRGGVATAQDIWSKKMNPGTDADRYIVGPILTGSGPIEQCFLQNPALECDLFGNMLTQIAGIRVGPGGRLEFIPNNTQYILNDHKIFQSNTDTTAWKAIRLANTPQHYEFCDLDSEGVVCYRMRRGNSNNNITFTTTPSAVDGNNEALYNTNGAAITAANAGQRLADIQVGPDIGNDVPSILYESGLLLLPDSHIKEAFGNAYCSIRSAGNDVTFFTMGGYTQLINNFKHSSIGSWEGTYYPADASGIITSRLRARVTS